MVGTALFPPVSPQALGAWRGGGGGGRFGWVPEEAAACTLCYLQLCPAKSGPAPVLPAGGKNPTPQNSCVPAPPLLPMENAYKYPGGGTARDPPTPPPRGSPKVPALARGSGGRGVGCCSPHPLGYLFRVGWDPHPPTGGDPVGAGLCPLAPWCHPRARRVPPRHLDLWDIFHCK